ncbi:MAG: sensor histidine kinase [Eubacterium sp.]
MGVWQNTINISVDFCGVFLCFFGIIGMIISKKIIEQRYKIFILMLTVEIFALISNILALMFNAKQSLFAIKATHIFYFSEYFFSIMLSAAVSFYIISTINRKKRKLRYIRIVNLIYVINLSVLIISQFTNLYYFIDENNIYHRAEGFWLSQFLLLNFTIFDFILVIVNRKLLSKIQIASFFCYIILPTAAIISQLFIYDIYLILISTTVATIIMLLMMLSVYVEQYREKERALVDLRIAIMMSQIKPHFLYNSLTAIAQLCENNPTAAKQATIAFSDYLRNNMHSIEKKELIPITEELKHIKTYLYLEKMRFDDYLEIEYDIKATDFYVPSLSVQPIVENAVKWGIGEKENGGVIKISTCSNDENFEITVIDDGNGFDASKSKTDNRSHIGIENVRKRLEVMCSGRLVIDSVIGKGTTVRIIIPREGNI